ncbi:hypothetical protein BCR42DRAFT_420015 [Absidia repens]|uniref:Uncharacterized protein n=1 Tax=Absidia repens TaxID=90262 RepID=A0A1X2IAK7_9FUNG|nr:hypothetical protein BCR42DRAFT_420015 [Absidia repens]
MLHNSLTTSQRLISYFLSLFDIQSYSQQQQQQQQEQYYGQSPLPSPTYISSSSYFLNDSIVMVHRRSNKFTYQSDPWSLHTWLKGLSKHVLYQLFIDMRPRLSNYYTGTAATTVTATDDSVISSRLGSSPSASSSTSSFSTTSPLPHLPLKLSSAAVKPPSILTMMKQVLLIQQHAREIVQQLDHLRPSEQFAKASMTAHSLHQLVRLAADTLRPHSTLALLAILTIVQELLDASSSELRRHVFYRSKWGRTVILEMAAILKTFTLPPSLPSSATSSHDDATTTTTIESSSITTSNNHSMFHLKKWSTYLIACLNPPTVANEQGWILDWLELICTNMAKYDLRWKFRHEYQEVIQMAKESL